MSQPVVKNYTCLVYSTIYDGKFYVASGVPTTLFAKYGPSCTSPVIRTYPVVMLKLLTNLCGECLVDDLCMMRADCFLWLLAAADMGVAVVKKLGVTHGQAGAVMVVRGRIMMTHDLYSQLKMDAGVASFPRTKAIYQALKKVNDGLA